MPRGREFCRLAALGVAVLALFGPGVSVASAETPGCTLFPADNVWHSVVSGLPLHPRSAAWLTSLGASTAHLVPEFSVPYTVVDAGHPRRAVQFDDTASSDAGPYPVDAQTAVESPPSHRALVVDRDACQLYELWHADLAADPPHAGAGAVFDLGSNGLRPAGARSADLAGLPILPGLVRREEITAGFVDHAVRMTASRTDGTFVWPARHDAGGPRDPSLPPMGARFRLRADYDMSGLRIDTQTVLKALQRYGLIVADTGSDWGLSGAAADWNPSMLQELAAVPSTVFEAVDTTSLMIDPDSGQARAATSPTTSTTTTLPPRPTSSAPPVTDPPATPAPKPHGAAPSPAAAAPPTTAAPLAAPATEPVAHREPASPAAVADDGAAPGSRGDVAAGAAPPVTTRRAGPGAGPSMALLGGGILFIAFGALMRYIRKCI